MRTHLCGDAAGRATSGTTVTVCGWVAKRREHGEHLAFVDLRDHTGHRPVRGRRDGRRAQRVRGARRGHGPAPARGHGQPRPAHRRGRAGRLHGRGAQPGRAAALRRRRPGRGGRGRSACSTASSTCAGPACSPTCGCGPRSTGPCGRPWSARASSRWRPRCCGPPPPRGPASSPCPAGSPRAASTCCPRAPRWPSSCSWWPGWTATTRSPGACATRTCGPTGSSSSPSSTSRRPSSPRRTSSASSPRPSLDAAEAATGERPADIPRMTWAEAMDRFGTDKPDLRFGMELVDLRRGVRRHRGPGLRGPVREGPACLEGGAAAQPVAARRADRPGQGSSGPRAWPGSGSPPADGGGPALDSPLDRFLSDDERAGLLSRHRRGRRRPGAGGGRRVPAGLHGARPAPPRPRRPPGRRGPVPLSVGDRLPPLRRRRRRRPSGGRPPPLHHAPSRRPRPAGDRPGLGALPGLRPGAQRLGARIGQRSGSTARTSSAGSSPRWASPPRRPRPASASCSGPSATGPRPTAASPWASTGSWPSSPGRTTIREVIAFPKTQSGSDPMTGAPKPLAHRACCAEPAALQPAARDRTD